MGAATLLVACVFAAGWVRSWCIEDLFLIALNERQYEIYSVDGMILECSHRLEFGDDGTTVWLNESTWHGLPPIKALFLIAKAYPHFSLQYWPIVLPLTLLSAYLLLIKPQPRRIRLSQHSVNIDEVETARPQR